jgi:hypothetical protein
VTPLRHRLASYLLGAFVCAELIYLPLSNILQRVPRRMPLLPNEIIVRHQREGRATDSDTIQAAIDAVGSASDRWGEATSQTQGWSLFAPRFGKNGTFLTLEVVGANGQVTELRSRFEPADPDHYIRFDVTHYRLFYREMSYALVYWMWEPDSFETRGEEWRDVLRDYATTFRHSLSAYVRWRLAEEMSGADVRQVIVAVRVFQPPKPGESRPAPATVPMARWMPSRPEALSAYDPVSKGFSE